MAAKKVKIGYDDSEAAGAPPRTLYDKVFESHTVHTEEDGTRAACFVLASL